MTIKDDLSKYPCFLYQMGTIRPIPEPTAWSNDIQAKMHYDLHAMGEDTFFKRYGIEKHKLLFNRKLWRAGAYD